MPSQRIRILGVLYDDSAVQPVLAAAMGAADTGCDAYGRERRRRQYRRL